MGHTRRRGSRLARAAAIGAAVALATVAGTSAASANGSVTWTNKATGNLLGYGENCGCVYSGGYVNSDEYQLWYDMLQPDHTWLEANEGLGGNWCLDSNRQWENGQEGNVYTTPCTPTSGNAYQHWYEIPTNNGWALQDKATGLYLDGGGGPNNTGAYTNGNYAVGNNYQHWT